MTPGEIYDIVFNSGIIVLLGIWVLKHCTNNNIHLDGKDQFVSLERYKANNQNHDERKDEIVRRIDELKTSIDNLVTRIDVCCERREDL